MPRTKGSKNKKAIELPKSPMVPTKEPITELGKFGNQEMFTLIDKVNEIIRRLNK